MPTSREQVFKKLGLRTQPFFPEIGPDEKPVLPQYLARALDPRNDQRVLQYYYDVYDWSGSAAVQGLTPEGLKSFPMNNDPDRPLLVIISGTRSTGRDSLLNLILHKVSVIHGQAPRVLAISDIPRNPELAVKHVARFFMAGWPAETQEKLGKIFDLHTKEKSADTDVHYSPLFFAFRETLKAELAMPTVLSIVGTDSYDIWKSVYLSCKKLFDYIVVQTKNPRAAKTCKTSMAENAIVAHIDAQPLSEQGALDYARTRVFFERIDQSKSLAPLTAESISLLYEPGKSAQEGEEKQRPIGWLRETLRNAVEKHVARLIAIVDEENADLEKLSPELLLISRDTVWNARQEMNLGKGV